MRKLLAIVLLLAAATAFAHGGHQHSFLGTVTAVDGNALSVTTREGKTVTFTLTEKTRYESAKKPAKKSDLVAGARVSIEVENDGKSVVVIKIGKAK